MFFTTEFMEVLMHSGVVKWLSKVKRYGFIVHESGDDIFFHLSGVQKNNFLKRGDRVEFETISDSKGLKAVNIKKMG